MNSLLMQYEEWAPGAGVAQGISGYWRFAVAAGAGPLVDHVIVPDGLVSVTALYNRSRLGGLLVMGPATQARRVPIMAGDISIGIRIRPGYVRALLGVDPATLVDAMMPWPERMPWAGDVFGDPRLLDGPGFDRAAADLVRGRPDGDAMVGEAADLWIGGGLDWPVSRAAARFGISERQLRRRFVAHAGVSPKTFSRVRRHRSAWVDAVTAVASSLTTSALDSGYADQAHFSREVRSLFGETPGAIRTRLRMIGHRFAGDCGVCAR